MHSYLFPLILLGIILSGSAIALQAPINAQLREWVSGPLQAALVSFAIGSAALLGLVLLSGVSSPRPAAVAAAPWWVWTGGLLGVVYVTISIVATPRVGPALFFGLLITGQLATSLLLEHYGLFGLPRHPVSLGRLVGVGLLLLGTYLIRKL